jgi:hypothetical protein
MGPKPIAQIPAQTAYLNLTENYPIRRDGVVETKEIKEPADAASRRLCRDAATKAWLPSGNTKE